MLWAPVIVGQPFDWSVVIRGAWNRAILTPDGIARRLLQLENATVEVEVALDQPGLIRVRHEGLLVIPSAQRLTILPAACNADGLRRAAEIANRAIQCLPETPFSAAGVNLRFRFDGMPPQLGQILTSPIDSALSDAAYRVVTRAARRSVGWEDGLINLEIDETENADGVVQFNFHRDSDDGDALVRWLSLVEPMVSKTSGLLEEVIGVRGRTEEENEDE